MFATPKKNWITTYCNYYMIHDHTLFKIISIHFSKTKQKKKYTLIPDIEERKTAHPNPMHLFQPF